MTGEGLAGLMAAIESLVSQEVLVGIPASASRDDSPLTNAEIGYLNETGSPAQNIPARPWLVPAVESVQDRIADRFVRATNAALDGDADAVNRHLMAAGMIAQNAARAKINSGDFEALAQSTIAARQRAGYKGIKPLIRSGQLRNSIIYVMYKKGSDNGAS